jgi:hypothetical protein
MIRMRGHAPGLELTGGKVLRVAIRVNGESVGEWPLERPGLFVLEAPVADAAEYETEIEVSPVWRVQPDVRDLSVNISMIRLVPRE